MSLDGDVLCLTSLPDELQQNYLDQCLGSKELGRAAQVCTLWRSLQHAASAAVLRRRRGAGAPTSPCPMRSLRTWESLVSIVGPPTEKSAWRSEYRELDIEQDLQFGEGYHDPSMLWLYEEGQACSIAARLALGHHAKAIAWCVDAGWDEEDACAYTIIFNYGRGALCSALFAGSAKFAASSHAVDRALYGACVRSASAVAPDCYVNLVGAWGLSEVDPAWDALTTFDDVLDNSDVTDSRRQQLVSGMVGTSFHTWGVSGAERADSSSFPADEGGHCRGIHVPITYETHTAWECQEGPVVRFVSRPTIPNRAMRSLAQTSETAFDVPPQALVTLERVDEAGEWEVLDGLRPECRLFTVSVEYG